MRHPEKKKPALYVRADGELTHSNEPVGPAQLISTITLLKEENKTLRQTNEAQSLVLQKLEESMLIDTLSTLAENIETHETTIEQQRFAIRAYTQKAEDWQRKVFTLEKEPVLKKRLEAITKRKDKG